MGQNRLTITLDDRDVIQDIRRATGLPDEEWIKQAMAVYHLLLSETIDNVIRIVREDGTTASFALTLDADRRLKGGIL